MFNIGAKTELIGFDGKSISHIAHKLGERGTHTTIYDVWEPTASRGSVEVDTKYGRLAIAFRERQGWATSLELVKGGSNDE